MQEGKEKIAHFSDFFVKELKGLVKNAGIKFRRNRQSDGYKTEEDGYKTEEDGYKTAEWTYKKCRHTMPEKWTEKWTE